MKINTVRLRLILGLLAILLPWIVALLVGYIPASISATYYTNAGPVFMIILGACSVTLMSYKGYDWKDDLILTAAGICGIGICVFPCKVDYSNVLVGPFLIPKEISSTIHLVFAVVFFALLSINSIFLFTKGSDNPTPNKKKRNIIYIVCGIGMLASFGLILLPDFFIKTWLVETFALSFFGVSFLTKADIFPFLFCDTPYEGD